MATPSIDKDGFLVLIPKKVKEDKVPQKPKKEKPEKQHKNPFKKGSWKSYMYKRLKKWRSSKLSPDFHFVKLENIILMTDGETPKVSLFNRRLTKGKLEKLKTKHPECAVLINCGCNTYLKISLKSYLKLIEIDKICISVAITALDDGFNERFDFYDNEQVITNINDLMNFINYHRQCIEGIYEIQANVCSFTDVDFKFKIVVLKRNGKAEVYKGDMNDFMAAYSITPQF